MNILVTGGAGFIGSNFIHYLLQNVSDAHIVNFDFLTYAGNLGNLKSIEKNPHYEFIHGNIENFQLVDFIVKKYKIDHIANFAAETHVDRSISNPDSFIKTNVNGTLSLLNVARKNKINKFLQVSTDEVYGSLGFDDPAFTEESPLVPSNPYSASKTAADLLSLSFYHTFKLPVVITRCSNNYGPYQFPEKLIPLMIRNIQNKKPLPIYGDGTNVRDWIHVLDHCEGVYRTLIEGREGQVYNFGGDGEISNLQLVKLLIKKLSATEDLITFVKDRPGHDLRYAMNYSKAKKELGWSPKRKFEEGIQETIKWYIKNKDWVESVTSGDYLEYYKKQYGEL